MPDVLPMVATDVFVLVQEMPPEVALLSVVVAPIHTVDEPVIAAGAAFTVMIFVRKQPVSNVYVMVTTPAEMPVTEPVSETVATSLLLELQKPPVELVARVVLLPAHTEVAPMIVEGSALI